MKTIEIRARDFDLGMTLQSGQVFHWEGCDEGFIGAIGGKAVYLEQQGSALKVTGASAQMIRRYFALDHPLKEICASFPRDPTMDAANEFCRGLRIIRQPKWECLATFICSSMKQVAHIRQISLALRRRFGTRHMIHTNEAYDFPSAERLAGISERALRACALGYRAKNLRATAKLVASGEATLDAWRRLPDAELRERLCQLPGVGMKVANCVMLFAYERIAAFPIDIWIGRVLRETYFQRKGKVKETKLAEFALEYFGANGGYAQQYLFHHARMTKRPGNRNS